MQSYFCFVINNCYMKTKKVKAYLLLFIVLIYLSKLIINMSDLQNNLYESFVDIFIDYIL